MKAITFIVLLLALTRAVVAGDVAPTFISEQKSDRIIISFAGKPVAHFVFRDEKILRPYFAHVHTPDGIQVTRKHPPVAGKDATDHDTMHPGLWLAFGDISGNDFWRNKAVMRHERFSERPALKQGRDLTFATESGLIATNGTVLATMISRIQIGQLSEGYLLAWSAIFIPTTDSFHFGDQEEMGFGVRVATELTEKKGGVITSSGGAKSAKATWGRTAEWCDYSGTSNGRRAGVTLLPDPANFRASWFHNRDYGLMVANPFGANAFTKAPKSPVPVAKGATFRFACAAFIHSGDAASAPDIAAAREALRSNRFFNTR